jgi:hypothetical protein
MRSDSSTRGEVWQKVDHALRAGRRGLAEDDFRALPIIGKAFYRRPWQAGPS